MNINEITKIIDSVGGGQFHSVKWEKTLKTRKGIADKITKESQAILRLGVSYDNKKAVQMKRENGELPKENQGLPYGEWERFPYLIKHNGGYQLRVTTAENTTFKTKYYLNGEEVSKEDIEKLVLASEVKPSDRKIDVFNIKIENIKAIK